MWWGHLCVDNGLWRVILCMLAFPLLYTDLISFRCPPGCGAAGGARGSGPSFPNAPLEASCVCPCGCSWI